jgi:hypothetical protein
MYTYIFTQLSKKRTNYFRMTSFPFCEWFLHTTTQPSTKQFLLMMMKLGFIFTKILYRFKRRTKIGVTVRFMAKLPTT